MRKHTTASTPGAYASGLILAGDIGGTKTLFALFEQGDHEVRLVPADELEVLQPWRRVPAWVTQSKFLAAFRG